MTVEEARTVYESMRDVPDWKARMLLSALRGSLLGILLTEHSHVAVTIADLVKPLADEMGAST